MGDCGCGGSKLDLNIIGMTLSQAEAHLNANNIKYRLRSVDGESAILTMDYNPFRVNLDVKENIVINYTKG